ncbi:MAG: DUF4097 domain-containing protein [Oscillospiraceae bacterium]|nr:DUF4097 domain-containing protein [Oscillospiraceae bacterium]
MSRTKKWIIAAVILVAVGGVIFLGALAAVGFDASKLETWFFHTNTYEFSDDFDSISINTEVAGVTILPSDDGTCKVICYEDDTLANTVKVENGTLSIETINTRKWYNYIGIFSNEQSVTVYLPKDTYASLSASVTTGMINLSDIDFETASLEVITGEIYLDNVIADGTLSATVTTGTISLKACDAGEMYLETTTGSIVGTVLTEKIFVAGTNLGNVSVPGTTSGGICRATTVTGEIKLEIE